MARPDAPKGEGRFHRWRPRPLSWIERRLINGLVQPLPDQLAENETELERHKKIVAQGALDFLYKWDRIAADRIGFEGRNISRTISATSKFLKDGKIIRGLYPYLRKGYFFVGADVLEDPYLLSYAISSGDKDSLYHRLSFKQQSPQKGILQVSIRTGSTEDSSHIRISKESKNEVKALTTFAQHIKEEGQDHPLRLEPAPGVEVYYWGIDHNGDTTLCFRNNGELHVTNDEHVEFTDYYGQPCRVPLRTNLYKEINALIPDMTFPGLSK